MSDTATKIVEAMRRHAEPSNPNQPGQVWSKTNLDAVRNELGMSTNSFYGHLSKLRSAGLYRQLTKGNNEVLVVGDPIKVPPRSRKLMKADLDPSAIAAPTGSTEPQESQEPSEASSGDTGSTQPQAPVPSSPLQDALKDE